MASYDIVLRGGRVIDPESMLDGHRNVGINGTSVARRDGGRARRENHYRCPRPCGRAGFIDLHSHAQTLAGRRLQAHDGVTTALDLEVGRTPIGNAYRREALLGSPIHFGYAASWASARAQVLTGHAG